jgi:hypothetical protein
MVRETARASGCATRVLCGVAKAMMADARVRAAVHALAELASRLARDGESALVPGPEALAIMGAHDVTPAFGRRRPEIRSLPRLKPSSRIVRSTWEAGRSHPIIN